LESGVEVSGSDRQLSPLAERLQEAGAQVWVGHAPEHIIGADLVVRSSAVPEDNPEVQAAKRAGIPLFKRADFLGQLTAGRTTLAVAGTHGKTTTTAMLAWMLAELGLDPSYIIGGISLNLDCNAHAGLGPYFVIEADEYDGMFFGLAPAIAIVTNIEHDHPDCYPTREDYQRAFSQFSERLQPQGVLLVCADDPGALWLAKKQAAARTCRLYGIQESDPRADFVMDYRAANLVVDTEGRTHFTLLRPEQNAGEIPVELQVPGSHNVRNAVAALAVIDLLGLNTERGADALSRFTGTGRRFELLGEAWGVALIDDYAHHPSEIRATLSAARQRFPQRSIWAVWQPHTYSRTRLLADEFAAALSQPDLAAHILVLGIYAARETQPVNGFSSRSVADHIQHPDVAYAPTLEQAKQNILSRVQPGEVVLVFSAGDADQLNADLLRELSRRSSLHPSDADSRQ
jgi:UDP-N-acetylmuramate--alanine ligase